MKLKDWLGGLDSNQDSQIQSLESYQLDDLPAVENQDLCSLLLCHHRRVFTTFQHSAAIAVRYRILSMDDIVAVKHRSCFVATDHHGYSFVHADFHQILDS